MSSESTKQDRTTTALQTFCNRQQLQPTTEIQIQKTQSDYELQLQHVIETIIELFIS